MDIIKAKIDSGEELDETERENLLNICNRRDDAIEKFGDEKRCGGVLNFLGEYAPLVEGNEEAIKEHIKTETNRYGIVEEYKTTIKNIQTKLKNNEKITPEDVNTIKDKLEEYNTMTIQIVTDTQTALHAEEIN